MEKHFRYVRFDNGEYMFVDLYGKDLCSHQEMVELYKKENRKDALPVSASHVSVYEQYFIIRNYSMTLKMEADEQDTVNFAEMFKIPCYEDRVI